MNSQRASNRIVQTTFLTFACTIAAWIGAWILKTRLDGSFAWFSAGLGSFLYWTAAKLLIWIAPALWLLERAGLSAREVLGLRNWRAGLAWGGGVGLLIALTGIIPNYLQGRPIFPAQLDFGLVNVLLIAPTFEEFLMRGAIQGSLQERWPIWTANMITSVLFVILHIPGWYFMGTLADNLTQPAGGALSIFLVSLAFGYAVRRSGSLLGGMAAHFLNNLF